MIVSGIASVTFSKIIWKKRDGFTYPTRHFVALQFSEDEAVEDIIERLIVACGIENNGTMQSFSLTTLLLKFD